MRPHERQYELNGKSVNIEKIRMSILETIDDNPLTLPQLADALKTEPRKLQYILLNMHTIGLVHINKEEKFHRYSKVKAPMLQDIFHPMPDFSNMIKGVYIYTNED